MQSDGQSIITAHNSSLTVGTPSNLWNTGLFQSGQFYKSLWLSGTASGGTLLYSYIQAYIDDTYLSNTTIGDLTISMTATVVSPNPTLTIPNILLQTGPYYEADSWSYSIYMNNNIINNALIAGGTFMTNSIFNAGMIFGDNTNFSGITHRAPVWYNGIFNGGQFIGASKWYDGQFNNGIFNADDSNNYGGYGDDPNFYAWLGGTFSGGIFGEGNLNGADGYRASWYNGVFTGGKFKGRVWRNGLFLGGQFEGPGVSQSVVTQTDSFMSSFNPDYDAIPLMTRRLDSNYGVWLNGVVSDSIKKSSTQEVLSNDFEISRIKLQNKDQIKFDNMLWVNGAFDNNAASFNNSAWLSGTFSNGQFNSSNFNPYVNRWDFATYGGSFTYSYELTTACIWENGVLNDSMFSISEWNNGLFLSGTMSGARFNQGTSNYMSAINVIWADGRWRNGTWYGSEFIFSSASSIIQNLGLPDVQNQYVPYVNTGTYHGLTAGAMRDVLTKQSIRNGTQSFHIWNAFLGTNSYHPINNTEIINNTYSTTKASHVISGINYGINIMPYNVVVTYSVAQVYGYNNDFPIHTNSGISYSITTSSNTGYLFAKIGNGNFVKGNWETGIWNDGLRLDTSFNGQERIQIFDSILNSYQAAVYVWNVILQATTYSNINVGDTVTIGNIVLRDINGVRNVYQDRCVVLESDGVSTIAVQLNIKYPISNIEKDSEFHKIYVTRKNWFSGVFLNGKFNGVWVGGQVKGGPYITQFTQSHWIGGDFAGGSMATGLSNSIYGNPTVMTFSSGATSSYYSTGVIQSGNFDTLGDSLNYAKTSLIFNYGISQDYNNYITSNTYKLVGSITNDVLSMNLKDNLSSTFFNKQNLILSYGTKYTLYSQFIPSTQSKLDSPGLTMGGTDYYMTVGTYPDSLTTNTSTIYNPGFVSLGANQVGIALKPTSNSTQYNIGITDKNTIIKNRYGLFTYNINNIGGLPSLSGDLHPYSTYFYPFNDYQLWANGINSINPSVSSDYTFKHFDYNAGMDPLLSWINIPSNTFIISNMQYTEVDMIPFENTLYTFALSTYSIPLIPYEATAPFIDYTNNPFNFATNVVFNFDTIIIPKKPIVGGNGNNHANNNNN